MSDTNKTCEQCGKPRPGSRFRDGERSWSHVCGACKAQITFSDPERVSRLKADIRNAVRAAHGIVTEAERVADEKDLLRDEVDTILYTPEELE